MENKEKTEITIENIQCAWQTLVDIFAEKENVKVQVTVERKK